MSTVRDYVEVTLTLQSRVFAEVNTRQTSGVAREPLGNKKHTIMR